MSDEMKAHKNNRKAPMASITIIMTISAIVPIQTRI